MSPPAVLLLGEGPEEVAQERDEDVRALEGNGVAGAGHELEPGVVADRCV